MSELSTGKELSYPFLDNVVSLEEVKDNKVKMSYCSEFLTRDEFVESIDIISKERPSLLIDVGNGGMGRVDEIFADKTFDFICNRDKVYHFFNKYTTMTKEQKNKFMRCEYTPLEDITSEAKFMCILKLILDEETVNNHLVEYISNKLLKNPYMPFKEFVSKDYKLHNYGSKLIRRDTLELNDLLTSIDHILKDNDSNYDINYLDYIKDDSLALIAYLISKFINIKFEDSKFMKKESVKDFDHYIEEDEERYKNFAKILLKVIKGKSYYDIENSLSYFVNNGLNYYPVNIGEFLSTRGLPREILYNFIVESESLLEDSSSEVNNKESNNKDLSNRINTIYNSIPDSQKEFLNGDSPLEKLLDYMERYLVD